MALNLHIESFEVLVHDYGIQAARRDPLGNSVSGIDGIWYEDLIERDYSKEGNRTVRTGVLTIRDKDAPAYEFGEQWTVEGVLWQVQHLPHYETGLRVYNLRRDEKFVTATSRGHIL